MRNCSQNIEVRVGDSTAETARHDNAGASGRCRKASVAAAHVTSLVQFFIRRRRSGDVGVAQQRVLTSNHIPVVAEYDVIEPQALALADLELIWITLKKGV